VAASNQPNPVAFRCRWAIKLSDTPLGLNHKVVPKHWANTIKATGQEGPGVLRGVGGADKEDMGGFILPSTRSDKIRD
jgi:hypothetical protein